MTMLFLVFILAAIASLVSSQSIASKYLPTDLAAACGSRKAQEYPGFYTYMELDCDYTKFLDTRPKPPANAAYFVFKMNFRRSKYDDPTDKYSTLPAGIFNKYNIRSLSLSNCAIKSISPKAFDENFNDQLEELDLSGNVLRILDKRVLAHMGRLQRLNLRGNPLALTDRNFESMPHLQRLDLSENDLYYLPSNLLANLNQLRTINLSRNKLQRIDACTFDQGDKKSALASVFATTIELNGNPIECDCDLFYLSRHLHYRVNATCLGHAKSHFYYGKRFHEDLKHEDPSERCAYDDMASVCEAHNIGQLELHKKNLCYMWTVIGLSCALGFFALVSCCCCCRLDGVKSQMTQLKRRLAAAQQQQQQQQSSRCRQDEDVLIKRYGN